MRETCFESEGRLPFHRNGNLATAAEIARSRRVIGYRWLAKLIVIIAIAAVVPSLSDADRPAIASPRLADFGAAMADEVNNQRAISRVNPDGKAWRILASEGNAASRSPNGDWMSVSVGAAIPPATQVRAGRRGRLVLSKDGDRIAMSPGAVVEIEERTPDRSADRVRQVSGRVQYDLNRKPATEPDRLLDKLVRALFSTKQSDSRFEVDTPHLVAGVKGTRFSVSVTDDDTRVSVSSGVVNVRNIFARTGEDIVAGQVALASTNRAGVHVTGQPVAGASSVDTEGGEASGDRASYRVAIFIVIALAFAIVAAIAIAAVVVAAARWSIAIISTRFALREGARQTGDDQ